MKSKVMDQLKAQGFHIEQTGGGCTAWAMPLPKDGYIWVTSDATHEIEVGDDVCIGIYDAEGDCIAYGTSKAEE